MKKPANKTGYYILPKLPFMLRFLLCAALILGGFYLQMYHKMFIIGFVILVAGGILAARRRLKIDVKLSNQKPEWKDVTVEKWDQIVKLEKTTKKWKGSFSNILSGKGGSFFSFIALGIFVLFIILIEEDPSLFALIFMDGLALLIPIVMMGSISSFSQSTLLVKLKALKHVYKHFSESKPDLELKPMLGLKKGTQDGRQGQVPVDAKMMIRLKGQPDNFYGVQVQCSLNAVSGTHYPYVYAVVLSAPDHKLTRTKHKNPYDRSIILEPSTTAEATIVVVRQKTTKTSGYHTQPVKQVQIIEQAIKIAEKAISS